MFDLLLINGIIITVDENNRVIENGYVAIQDERIVEIGEMSELKGTAKKVMNMEGHAILPGLIDGHGHCGHSLQRTLNEHDPNIENMMFEIQNHCSDNEFWYDDAVIAAIERIKFGTTTAVSMFDRALHPDYTQPLEAAIQGASTTGIRQFTGCGAPYDKWIEYTREYKEDGSYIDLNIEPEMFSISTEKTVKELNNKYKRATCIVAAGRMGQRPNVDDKTNQYFDTEMYRISRKYNVPLHTHCYGGDIKAIYERTPEILGPWMSCTHLIGISDEEIDILSKTKPYFFHGPTTWSNVVGHPKVIEMMEKGIPTVIVTDGSGPDRSYDLWRDMKNVQLFQRFRKKDAGLFPGGTVLRMATIEPAKALGIDSYTGSLEVGKKADIITVDMMQAHLVPFHVMPIQRLVYHAMGQDVDNVIIEGEIVMENRKMTLVDEKQALKNAQKSFEKMYARLNKDVMTNPKLYDLRMF